MGEQHTYLSSDPAHPHLGGLRPCIWHPTQGLKNNISAEAKWSIKVCETLSKGNSISPKEELVLKALRFMLKSRGLELSNSNAVKTWDIIVTLAFWVPSSNLFSILPGPR